MGAIGSQPPHIAEAFEAVPRRDGRDVVVALRGELDLAGAPQLSQVMSVVRDVCGQRVVLDLSELAFTDVSGIRAIAGAREELCDQGVEVMVRHAQPAIRRVLGLCGIDDSFEVRGKRVPQSAGQSTPARSLHAEPAGT